MISNKIEDYEVLSILGADLNSTCYKVRDKSTSEIFVWKAISCENLDEKAKKSLLSQIEKQKSFRHPHLIQTFDYILQEETKIVYLISEYCSNGNLNNIVQKCLIENEYLHENFLWRVLYQTACTLKIRGGLITLNLNNIFVDENYHIKLFNNDVLNKHVENGSFGLILFQLSTLQNQKINTKSSVVLTNIPSYYSNELKEIIKFAFSPDYSMNEMINAILCHPTILLKSTQIIKNIFVKNPIVDKTENYDQLRLENLKSREAALKTREQKLTTKEHELQKREKRIIIQERAVKDKILQAELYLRRCREIKSSSENSTKTQKYDETSLTDCGDCSIVVPTSRKLNLEIVKKPHHFVRTLSERRVQFKGHSPLKEKFNKNTYESVDRSLKGIKPKKKLDLFAALPVRSRKPLVDQHIIYEESDECRPISWTEESKQQAFDLLRVMKQCGEKETIKHTYL